MRCRRLYIFIFGLILLVSSCVVAKNKKAALMKPEPHAASDTFLVHLLHQYPQYFDTLLQQNEVWGIQIVYTQINRSRRNKPRFTHHYFNTESGSYFYPASTVKLPV